VGVGDAHQLPPVAVDGPPRRLGRLQYRDQRDVVLQSIFSVRRLAHCHPDAQHQDMFCHVHSTEVRSNASMIGNG